MYPENKYSDEAHIYNHYFHAWEAQKMRRILMAVLLFLLVSCCGTASAQDFLR